MSEEERGRDEGAPWLNPTPVAGAVGRAQSSSDPRVPPRDGAVAALTGPGEGLGRPLLLAGEPDPGEENRLTTKELEPPEA